MCAPVVSQAAASPWTPRLALVGPPARTMLQHQSLGAIVPGHARLLEARPGLIGVSTRRDQRQGRAARLRCELDYVENWRLSTDAAVISTWALNFPFEGSEQER